MCNAARPHSALTSEVLEHYFLAGPKGFEPSSCGFGDRCVSVTPRPQEGRFSCGPRGDKRRGIAGVEPRFLGRCAGFAFPLPGGELAEDYQRKPGVPNESGLAFVAPWMVCSLPTVLGHDVCRYARRALNGDSPRSTDSAVSICDIGEDQTPRSRSSQADIRRTCSRNEEDPRPAGRRSLHDTLTTCCYRLMPASRRITAGTPLARHAAKEIPWRSP